MAGISVWQLAIILVIVMLLFGTKKFRTIGTDLGGAIRGFKKAVNDEGSDALEHQVTPSKEVNKENKINN